MNEQTHRLSNSVGIILSKYMFAEVLNLTHSEQIKNFTRTGTLPKTTIVVTIMWRRALIRATVMASAHTQMRWENEVSV